MKESTRRKFYIDLYYYDNDNNNNNNDDDDDFIVVKSQVCTRIVNIEGMEYKNCSSRASLPKSKFTKS